MMSLRTLLLRREQSEKEFWRQRGWVVSAAFLGLVLVSGCLALTLGSGEGGVGAGPPADAALVSRGAAARPAGCATDDTDRRMPSAAPADLQWSVVGGVRVPTSPTAGPLVRRGAVWSCFARTPMGAVLAAHVITAHMSTTDWRTVALHQIVSGPGRDRFVFQRQFVRVSSDPPSNAYAGFLVSNYTNRAAAVRILIFGQGSYASTTIRVEWSDGDWKVAPDPDGSLYSPMTTDVGAGGFIKWSK